MKMAASFMPLYLPGASCGFPSFIISVFVSSDLVFDSVCVCVKAHVLVCVCLCVCVRGGSIDP